MSTTIRRTFLFGASVAIAAAAVTSGPAVRPAVAAPRTAHVHAGDARAYAFGRHLSGFGNATLRAPLMATPSVGFTVQPLKLGVSPPVVLADGTMVVVGESQIAWVDPKGKAVRLVDVNRRPFPPYAWSSAGRMLVASGGAANRRIVAYDRGGVRRFELPVASRVELLMPGPAGTFLYTTEDEATWCWPDGQTRARVDLPNLGTNGRMFVDRRKALMVAQNGVVWRWNPPKAPQHVAEFAPGFAHVERVSEHGLIAQIGLNRLAALDTQSGQQREFYKEKLLQFVSTPLFVPARRRLAILRTDGVLLLLDPSGKTEKVSMFGDSTTPTRVRRAFLYAGKNGAIVGVAQDGRLRLVDPDGSRKSLTVPCRRVTSLRPGGPGRLLVGCSEGRLVEVIDAAAKQTKN